MRCRMVSGTCVCDVKGAVNQKVLVTVTVTKKVCL